MNEKAALDSLPQISEINMTPLMDLTFILLITFIITFPLIKQGIPLNLPKGKAAGLTEANSRTISMDLQGGIYLDGESISVDNLTTEMKTLGKANPDMIIYVSADKGIKYGELVKILAILHKAGMSRTALVMAPGEETRRK